MQKRISILVLALSSFITASGQIKVSTLQSVFIYSAIKYMEWPNDELSDFTITVLGDSPIYDELIKVSQKKKAGARNITVLKANSVDEVTKCHILFIAPNKASLLNRLNNSPISNSTLIITEQQGALNQGSDLNFFQRGEKIAFQISEKSLSDKKIKVSSAFSNLAER